MVGKDCMIGWLKNIFSRNFGLENDLVDWESEVDGSLSYAENYGLLKESFGRRGLLNRIYKYF